MELESMYLNVLVCLGRIGYIIYFYQMDFFFVGIDLRWIEFYCHKACLLAWIIGFPVYKGIGMHMNSLMNKLVCLVEFAKLAWKGQA